MKESHNLVPHLIIDKFKAGEHHGSFPTVGMFIDLSGFSAITDTLMEQGQHGAEVLAMIMRDIFSPLIQGVYEKGGFITTIAGDAFTALFPIKEEKMIAIRRALYAASGVQNYMAAHPIQDTTYGKFNVTVKIGIALGEVDWGILRSEDNQRAVYYFRGTAIEGCTAAEQQAKSGDIVLDEGIYKQIKRFGTAKKVDEHFILTGLNPELEKPSTIKLPLTDEKIITHFYPESLLERSQSSEFRQVINMFINLPTVRTEAQLEIFMRSLFDLQQQHGGLLTRLDFGDKGSNLLLMWGAPIAFENDLANALDLILELQTHTSMPISAGITYQIAHTGFIGSPLREEYTNYGRGVNLAARFMSTAPRGDIWVDEQVYKRTNSQFEIEYEGEFSFKGFSEKQKVYNLYERKERTRSFFQGEMVGRDTELKQIEEFLSPLNDGKYCGAQVIWGDPGIGKSRLVHEISTRELFDGLDILWAFCQADQSIQDSLNPFRYWLNNYFGVSKSQIEARNKRNFNRKLDGLISAIEDESLGTDLDRNRSFLAALLGLYWPDSLFEQMDAQGRYDNTLIALSDLIRAESLLQPIVIQLEDSQWLDQESRIFLPMLERILTSDQNRTYPVAIIATARREYPGPILGDGLLYSEIDLGELSDDSLTQLAKSILGGQAAPELLALVSQRAEGNPFFAEQILVYLQEENLLNQDGDLWKAKESSIDPLPDDVRNVLVSRLDRLTLDVKNVVQTAAILGREFELDLLAFMLEGDNNIPKKVATAENGAIWSALNEMRYLFNHALLHDTAYRMQLRARREKLHTIAVGALETLYAEELSSHYAELAYHSERANITDKALSYLLSAGEIARDFYQNNQALDYYTRALKFLSPEDLKDRFDILISTESINKLLGEIDNQKETLIALSDIIEESLIHDGNDYWLRRSAELSYRWANYYTSTGAFQKAIDPAKNAISLAEQTGSLDIAVKGNLILSNVYLTQGNHDDAFQWAEQSLHLAKEIGDHREESHALNQLGLLSLEHNELSKAKEYFTQCLEIAREIGDLRDQALPLNNLGIISGTEGNYSYARDYYERALTLAREIGDRSGEGLVLGNLGWIAGIQGDYTTASDYGERQLMIARQVGNKYLEAYALINLSFSNGTIGDFKSALDYAEQGLALSKKNGDRSAEAWSLTSLGNSSLELNNLNAAHNAYKQALEIRESLSQPNLATEPIAGLARVALANGDIAEAINLVEGIFKYLDDGGTLESTEEPLRVYLICYQILRAAKDPRSTDVINTANDLLQSRIANIKDTSLRKAYLEDNLLNKEIISTWKEQNNPD